MKAHFEPTAGIVRVLPDGAAWGDPFDLAVFIVGDEGTAIVKGLRMDGYTRGHRDAIAACLREAGFRWAVWHRYGADGRRREVRARLGGTDD